MTSSAKAAGRFGKQDFVYVAAEDVYRCPAGERLLYRYTNEEDGKTLRRYWTTACQTCALKAQCTTGKERRISGWEHETVLGRVPIKWNPLIDKDAAQNQTVGACRTRKSRATFSGHTLETVQDRLDRNKDKMRVRRQTVEHPFGTIKAWMGATHQMRKLPKVASEMAPHVLACNVWPTT